VRLDPGYDFLFNELAQSIQFWQRPDSNPTTKSLKRGRAIPALLRSICKYRGTAFSHQALGEQLAGFKGISPEMTAKRVYQYPARLKKLLGEEVWARVLTEAADGEYTIASKGWAYMRVCPLLEGAHADGADGSPSDRQ
jgi:hypothetical protein